MTRKKAIRLLSLRTQPNLACVVERAKKTALNDTSASLSWPALSTCEELSILYRARLRHLLDLRTPPPEGMVSTLENISTRSGPITAWALKTKTGQVYIWTDNRPSIIGCIIRMTAQFSSV